jgi:hypothetical protein
MSGMTKISVGQFNLVREQDVLRKQQEGRCLLAYSAMSAHSQDGGCRPHDAAQCDMSSQNSALCRLGAKSHNIKTSMDRFENG